MRFPTSFCILIAGALASAGCSGRYMGIDRSGLSPALASDYDQAQAGSKLAQLELALAYANGVGVLRDCRKARALLRVAAAPSGGKIWVYSPPVGNGTSGRVIPIDSGPVVSGLIKAKSLLEDPDFCAE